MRTTVTIDEDVAASLQRAARERGVSFKVALNDAVRGGLATDSPSSRGFRVHARGMGIRPRVDIDKALSLATQIEDAETLRKLALRK